VRLKERCVVSDGGHSGSLRSEHERTLRIQRELRGNFTHRNILLQYPRFIPHLCSPEKSASPFCPFGLF
jgi:hypothetical protein